jgi:hypothetical protein
LLRTVINPRGSFRVIVAKSDSISIAERAERRITGNLCFLSKSHARSIIHTPVLKPRSTCESATPLGGGEFGRGAGQNRRRIGSRVAATACLGRHNILHHCRKCDKARCVGDGRRGRGSGWGRRCGQESLPHREGDGEVGKKTVGQAHLWSLAIRYAFLA